MAETVTSSKTKPGWQRTGMESSSDGEEDAIVPGVNSMGTGNIRPKQRSRPTRDVRTKGASKQTTASTEDIPSTTSISVQDLSQSLDERRLRPVGPGGARRGAAPASLKDLCVEDKRRIANLIKELARVGEEREKAREELDRERKDYERQILKLVEQQEQILRERQDVERHFEECQQLLAQSQLQRQSFPHHSLPPPPPPPTFTQPPPPPPAWAQGHVGQGHMQVKGQDPGHSLAATAGSVCSDVGWSGDDGHAAANPGFLHQNHHQLQQQLLLQQQQQQHQQQQQQHHQEVFYYQQQLQQLAGSGGEAGTAAAHLNGGVHPGLEPPCKDHVLTRFFDSQPPRGSPSQPRLSPPRQQQQLRRSDSGDGRKTKSSTRKKTSPYLPPVMSSTQKSGEIGRDLTQEYHALPVGGWEEGGESDSGGEEEEGEAGRGRRSRVVFAEGDEDLQQHRMRSPLGDGGEDSYRKLSQTQRKDLLLRQRAQLLGEQQRLKHVLLEQETALRDKQRALDARARHHGNRSLQGEEGGGGGGDGGAAGAEEDPLGLVPQRLAIDAALERQRAIVDSLELAAEHKSGASHTPTTTNSSSNHNNNNAKPTSTNKDLFPVAVARAERERTETGSRKRGKEEVEVAPSAPTPLSDIVRKLDYSLHSDSEVGRADEESSHSAESGEGEREGEDEGEEDTADDRQPSPPPPAPRQLDAGTSVSYRTLPRSGDLPLAGDDGDSLGSSGHGVNSLPSNPGEKTMSVLEIINAMGSPRSRHGPPLQRHPHPHLQHLQRSSSLHPHPSPSSLQPALSPFHQESSPTSSSLPYRELPPLGSQWRGSDSEREEGAEIVLMDSSEELEEEEEEEEGSVGSRGSAALEESQILEDIFFLK